MNAPEMKLPGLIRELIGALEQAGFEAWAVGGCVRDAALGIEPHDYDLCTSAAPEETEQVFAADELVLTGKKHGTVTVIREHTPIEITTYRTEGGYGDRRHPGWVKFVPDIEEDLSRRDFTVNAMAFHPLRGYKDPFGGLADLERRVLRTVGDPAQRFREDALRILRGVRFAVRFGLTPEEETLHAMLSLAPLMDELARERVFAELCGILPGISAAQLLLFAPILARAIPQLAPAVGMDQRNPHHDYDLFTHISHVVAGVPGDITLRLAALLHDIGKPAVFTLDETGRGHFYGHAQVGAEMADEILRTLHAPTRLRERVVFLVKQHMTILQPDRKSLRRHLSRWGEEATRQLLALQRADSCGKSGECAAERAYFARVEQALEETVAENACLSLRDLAISGKDLLEAGFPAGKAMGALLNRLLEEVLAETCENTPDALLARARELGK